MKQAMIFAAGLGTRLRPLTDTMPKALVSVAGQPLLWHVLTKLKAAGYGHIVINVHHFAQQIIDYLHANDNFGLDIRISDETDGLLETGGGIKKARPLFDPTSPILIHNVDILSNLDLTSLPTTDTQLVVSPRKTTRYLLFNADMHLVGWKNIATGEVRGPASAFPTPSRGGVPEGRGGVAPSPVSGGSPPAAPVSGGSPTTTPHSPRAQRFSAGAASSSTPLAFSGIHVLSPDLLPLMDSWPDRFPIIDFYLSVCADRRIMGYVPDDLRLLDVGKLDTLDEAESFLLPPFKH